MPSKRKLPEIEFAAVLRKAREKTGTLSICVDGKNYQWPISKKRSLRLLASIADSLADQRE